MNPEQNQELRQQLEVRIVALLLGEASAFETAELQELLQKDPELTAFHDQMRRTIGLVKEASKQFTAGTQPAVPPPKLSPERRAALLARFKQTKAVETTDLGIPTLRPQFWRKKWLVPVSVAAGIVLVAGVITLPDFIRATKSPNLALYSHAPERVTTLPGVRSADESAGRGLVEPSPPVPASPAITVGPPVISEVPPPPATLAPQAPAQKIYLPEIATESELAKPERQVVANAPEPPPTPLAPAQKIYLPDGGAEPKPTLEERMVSANAFGLKPAPGGDSQGQPGGKPADSVYSVNVVGSITPTPEPAPTTSAGAPVAKDGKAGSGIAVNYSTDGDARKGGAKSAGDTVVAVPKVALKGVTTWHYDSASTVPAATNTPAIVGNGSGGYVGVSHGGVGYGSGSFGDGGLGGRGGYGGGGAGGGGAAQGLLNWGDSSSIQPPSGARRGKAVAEQGKPENLLQDGKLLYEAGKWTEAQDKLRQALREDPNNRAATYYLDLAAEKTHRQSNLARESWSKDRNQQEQGGEITQLAKSATTSIGLGNGSRQLDENSAALKRHNLPALGDEPRLGLAFREETGRGYDAFGRAETNASLFASDQEKSSFEKRLKPTADQPGSTRELAPLPLKLPAPAFVGTPTDLPLGEGDEGQSKDRREARLRSSGPGKSADLGIKENAPAVAGLLSVAPPPPAGPGAPEEPGSFGDRLETIVNVAGHAQPVRSDAIGNMLIPPVSAPALGNVEKVETAKPATVAATIPPAVVLPPAPPAQTEGRSPAQAVAPTTPPAVSVVANEVKPSERFLVGGNFMLTPTQTAKAGIVVDDSGKLIVAQSKSAGEVVALDVNGVVAEKPVSFHMLGGQTGDNRAAEGAVKAATAARPQENLDLSLKFSTDPQRIVTTSGRTATQFWDARTGQRLTESLAPEKPKAATVINESMYKPAPPDRPQTILSGDRNIGAGSTPAAAPADKPAVQTGTVARPESKKQLDYAALEQDVKKRKAEVDRLGRELKLPDKDALIYYSASSTPVPDTLRGLETLHREAQSEYEHLKKLYSHLTNLNQSELPKLLATASPDPLLASLLEERSKREKTLADQQKALASDHPDVKRTQQVIERIDRQLDDRSRGVLEGVKAQTETKKATLEYLSQQIEDAKKGGIKQGLDRRAYFQAKRDLETAQRNLEIAKRSEEDGAVRKPAAPPPVPQPEVVTRENPFSTFSLNVSDVSFKLAGASLESGAMPEPASVRVEEFLNAFNYRDPAPAPGARLAFAWERARYPFAHNRDILRFAIQTAARGREAQKPLNLVILLDNSGSMERPDRVAILREALKVLAAQLRPQDRISVIAFARTARLWVDGMAGGKPQEFLAKVLDLNPDGGTNLEEAMDLGYATAAKHFLANGVNRVILLTDGAANLGNVEPEDLKKQVVANRQRGIALDCFGIGWEGYNDDLLEVLSRNGDGRYAFLNQPEAAAPEFADQLAGALNVAAADVKAQVEFNPQRVAMWRQIGYAKHQLTKEQFRDNTVDAAEIAAAEQGNALYVIEVNPQGNGPLGVARVRYKVPVTGQYVEQEWVLPYQPRVPALDQASPAMRLAVTASAFGEWLTRSPFASEVTLGALQAGLSGVPEVFAPDPRPQQLAWMLRQVQALVGK